MSISPRVMTHTAGDDYRWHYRFYPPTGQPRPARIVYLHGIQSHGGWYEGSCAHLAAAGFPVYFLDRRGSGLNEQDRGTHRASAGSSTTSRSSCTR